MSTLTLQQSRHTLTLTGEERENLLCLLRQALAESRVEAHRTHTPAFRESVLGHQGMIRSLIDRLEAARSVQTDVATSAPSGNEEGLPVSDAVYIDERGRFQMVADELEDFVAFLRDHDLRVDVDTADAFQSGGKSYSYGRLRHVFDADSLKELYRTWQEAHRCRAERVTA